MVRTTDQHDDDASSPTRGRPARRRRRVLVIAALGLVAGIGAAGTAVAGPDGVAGTPCTSAARACVDLPSNQAWLIKDGVVDHGPVSISHGGKGEETPTGTFSVQWKDAEHKSKEFDNAPMPWAVFFAPGGIAFHEGNPATPSAGCVRMPKDDAIRFFNDLQPDDQVEVH